MQTSGCLAVRRARTRVRDLIEQLQRQLDPEDARLLGAASVVGKEFSAAAVAAAVDHAEADVDARCDALARSGRFLEIAGEEAWPDGTVASRYEFDHDLQREVLYDLLPAGERARMHARVGARLEQAYAHDDGAAGLLAWHFARARDAVKAITYLGAAAEQALRRNAHEEAVGHLSAALDLLDRLPAGRERDERELALLTTLGTTQITVRGYTDPAVSETYARARQVSTRLGDGARRFLEEPPAARYATRDGPARPPTLGQRNRPGQEVRFSAPRRTAPASRMRYTGAGRRSSGRRPGSPIWSSTGTAPSGGTGSRGSQTGTRCCATTSGAAASRAGTSATSRSTHASRTSKPSSTPPMSTASHCSGCRRAVRSQSHRRPATRTG